MTEPLSPRAAEGASRVPLTLRSFQDGIERVYGERDRARGLDRTFVWFVEEVGELARALHRDSRENLVEEFGDCLAWLTTLASLAGVDLEGAAAKYAAGCPRCGAAPCACPPPRS